MKVLLFSEGMNLIKISGLGRAIMHQQKALKMNGIEYTLDPKDDYDVVHINTLGPKSKALAKKARKKGKRVVYHAHSTEEDFRNSFIGSNLVAGLFKRWICSCYKQGDVIATPTEYSKKLIQNYGIKNPIYHISNGIDLEITTLSVSESPNFLRKASLSPSFGLYISRSMPLEIW